MINVSSGMLLGHQNPVAKNQERITKTLRIQAENLNWNEVKCPFNLSDID